MKKKTRLYAAYGSNLNIGQMNLRCPQATIVGIAEIPNHRLLYKGSRTGSYLTVEESENSIVPVGIWEVNGNDEGSLDRYEGYPFFYSKKEMVLPVRDFRTNKTTRRKIFLYVIREDAVCAVPSAHYVNVCSDGYEDFGFDPEVLDRAFSDTMEVMEHA